MPVHGAMVVREVGETVIAFEPMGEAVIDGELGDRSLTRVELIIR